MSISDSKQNPYEEFFSRLVIPELSHAFTISKEETFEGEWVYRIYNFQEDLHKRIEEYMYDRIRELMQKASYCLNNHEDLAARTHLQKLINIWKERWDESGRN